jgi:hypothetical protein
LGVKPYKREANRLYASTAIVKNRWSFTSSHSLLLHDLMLSENVNIKVNKTVVLSFLLYGCKTWTATLIKPTYMELGLITALGTKRAIVTGCWRNLRSYKVNNSCSKPNTIYRSKEFELRRACSTHGRVEK